MSTDILPTLAEHLKKILVERHSSVGKAAKVLDIAYERLKKALQNNKFNLPDLEKLMPGLSEEELRQQFTFEVSKTYVRKTSSNEGGSQSRLVIHGLTEDTVTLITKNPAVAERVRQLIEGECARLRNVLFGN